jgi:hypothetical protein
MPGFAALSHSAMLAMLALPSRATVNHGIWSLGLVLQAALIWVVFRRGVARRFPGFTALITFYPLRAALLFALVGRIEADDYDTTVRVLGFLELALQAWVIVEIVLWLAHKAGRRIWRRGAAILALAAILLILTAAAFHWLPVMEPADPAQIFLGILMIALFFLALRTAESRPAAGWRNVILIPAGFALFAVLQLASLAGCAFATAHQHSGAYLAWAYVPACGYLGVVTFWLCALRREAASVRGAAPAPLLSR